MASFPIALPLLKQLSMKLAITLLLENTIDLLFVLEHKLYGFTQSEMRPISYYKKYNLL